MKFVLVYIDRDNTVFLTIIECNAIAVKKRIWGFHCHAIKIKNGNLLIQKSRIWEMKEDKYTKKLCQESGLCNTSYARYSEKRLTQIYNWFYVETPWLCPFEGHKYMAAGNQQKHLFLSFPTNA